MENQMILCAASAYTEKFYLGPEFSNLPESIIQELQIACVLYTADVGGELTMAFDEEGKLTLHASHTEDDFLYDEIGSVLKVKELQKNKRELFESLEMFYEMFVSNGHLTDESTLLSQ